MNIGILESAKRESTPLNISLMAYTGQSFVTTSKDALPICVFVKNDGNMLFFLGFNTKKIYKYTFGIPHDLSTLMYHSEYLSVLSTPTCFNFSRDGMKLYIWDNNASVRDIFQYNLSSAYDISSVTYVNRSNILTNSSIGIYINNDGTKTFTSELDFNKINSQILSTPYAIATATISTAVTLTESGTPQGICFSNNGTSLLVATSNNTMIKQYNLIDPFDLSTISYSGYFINVSAQQSELRSVCLSADDMIMYVAGSGTDLITKYIKT
jgi:hypothetical protein